MTASGQGEEVPLEVTASGEGVAEPGAAGDANTIAQPAETPPVAPPAPRRPDFLRPPPIVPRRAAGRRRSIVPKLLIALFIALVLSGGLIVAALSRVGTTGEGFLALDLSGEIPEEAPTIIFGKPPLTAHETLLAIREAKTQKRVKGLLLNIKASPGGLARLQALRRAIDDFKASGKPVVAFMESGGMGSYYLATAADEIVMVPTGDLQVAGLSAEEAYLRGTLDLLGIHPDLYHAGKYKSFSETFTDTAMSESHREVVESMLDDLYEQLVATIAKGRKLAPERVREIIDLGPFTAKDAHEHGLIDRMAYWDEVEESYKEKDDEELETIEPKNLVPRFGSYFADKIALVYETGQIVSGKSEEDPVFGGKTLGSDTMARVLSEIRRDDSIKAVVLRIDSPGGSGLASDVIWREVEKLKEAGKPVVVSMGDVAASGGYYIAAGADVIVAEPGTITGSIGVVSGKFALQGLYGKIGYNVEIITRGKNAAIYSGSRPFTDSEREVVVRQMEAFYKEFVDRVAKGRNKKWEEIHEIAQGRVWTGQQAIDIGLVDELGGLDRALALAKERAGIAKDAKVQVSVYPRKKTFLEMLLEEELTRVGHARLWQEMPASLREAARLARTLALFERETAIPLMPFRIRIH